MICLRAAAFFISTDAVLSLIFKVYFYIGGEYVENLFEIAQESFAVVVAVYLMLRVENQITALCAAVTQLTTDLHEAVKIATLERRAIYRDIYSTVEENGEAD